MKCTRHGARRVPSSVRRLQWQLYLLGENHHVPVFLSWLSIMTGRSGVDPPCDRSKQGHNKRWRHLRLLLFLAQADRRSCRESAGGSTSAQHSHEFIWKPFIILRNAHGLHSPKNKVMVPADKNNLEAGQPPDCDSPAIKEAINNQRRHRSHRNAPASRLLFTLHFLHI